MASQRKFLNIRTMSLYTQPLTDAGFTKHQAVVYAYLIENGPSGASMIARHTGIARTLTYRVLDELTELNLVAREDKKGAVSVYTPAHPVKLHDMVERRKQEAEQAAAAVSSVVDSLTSEYNKTLGKPGVVFYEGVAGVERVYQDILDRGESFLMIRAAHTAEFAQIKEAVFKFISHRVRKGIHVDAITPTDSFSENPAQRKRDEEMLFTRTMVDKSHYTAPVEIDIYGDRIAILSYGTELIATRIESKEIAQALRELFVLAKKGARTQSSAD